MRLARVAAVVLLAWLSGCDPDVEIVGKVVAADGGVPPSTKVELSCTGSAPLAVAHSAQTYVDSGSISSLDGTDQLSKRPDWTRALAL